MNYKKLFKRLDPNNELVNNRKITKIIVAKPNNLPF